MAAHETSETQRSPHEFIENRARAASRQRILVGISDLTQQLFLGDHRGVEAGDDLEDATHGFGTAVLARWRPWANVNGDELDAMARVDQHGLSRRYSPQTLGDSRSLITRSVPKGGEAHLDALQWGRLRQADGTVRGVSGARYGRRLSRVKCES